MEPNRIEVNYLSRNVEMDGKPVRFRKEIIRVGRFRHPQDPDEVVEITESRLRRWAENFRRAGVKVWVPYRHSADPKDNTGWVEDMFVDKNRLFAVIRVIDDETVRLLREGVIEDVSVGVDLDYVDAEGRRLGEVVRHVALTLDPYVREQQGFIEMTDERNDMRVNEKGGGGMPETIYAYVDPETGVGFYPHHRDDGTVDLEKVKAALEELEGSDLPEDVKTIIREHLLAHLAEAEGAAAATAEGSMDAEARTKLLELEAMSAELAERNKNLRRKIRDLRRKHSLTKRMFAEQEVDDYVAEGKLTPACRPEALAMLLDGTGRTLELEGGRVTVAETFRRLVAKMPPVVDFGEYLALEKPNRDEPLGESELKILDALGVSPADVRSYASTR
ncbi:MAG: hypothetical protein JSW52_10850 [Candidatus Coatesbacteria bacterium]|nr:MAG: hypothetical protein JSW52_10850 [Candidatus Coatesbacteria bacterium]